jgi:hypothetical protein
MLGATSVRTNNWLKDLQACIAALLTARDRVDQHATFGTISCIVESSIFEYCYRISE